MTVEQPMNVSGGADVVQMIQGLQGVISSLPAMIQEATGTIAEQMVRSQQQSTFGGTAAQSAQAASGGMSLDMLRQAVTDGMMAAQGQFIGGSGAVGGGTMTQGMGPGTDTPQEHDHGHGMVPYIAAQLAMRGRSTPLPAPTPTMPTPSSPDPSVTPRIGDGAKHKESTPPHLGQHGFSIEGLREDATNIAKEHIKRVTAPRWSLNKETGAYHSIDQSGNINPVGIKKDEGTGEYHYLDHTGNKMEGVTPAPSQIKSIERAGALRMVQGAAGGLGEAGGMMGSLAAVATPVAIGAAGVTAVRAGLHFAQDQREQNAEFQRIRGGSNVSAFGDRFKQRAFGLSQMGVMGAGEAERLYLGTAELGLKGGDQTKALNFATDSYKRFGATIEESMQILDTASKTGQESLTGLTKALEGVTKSAKSAGVNADAARQTFTQMFQTTSGTVGGGNAPAVAASLTGMQTSLGREFQDSNLAQGLSTDPVQHMIAASSGMTLGKYQSMADQSHGRGAQFVAQTTDKYNENVVGNALGSTNAALVSDFARKNPNAGEDQINELATQLGEQYGDSSQFLSQLNSRLGTTFNREEGLRYMAKIGLGQGKATDSLKQAQTDWGQRDLTANEKKSAATSSLDLSSAIGGINSTGIAGLKGRQRSRNQSRSDYTNMVQQTGKRDPILEGLLKDQDSARRFEVDTKNGKKVVGIDDLTKYYSDQAEAGTVQIVAGGGKGGTVADLLGATGDASVDVKSSSDPKLSGKGEDAKKFAAEQAKKDAKSGHVLIEAQPWLQQFFKFTPTGAAAMQANAQTNLVPPTSSPAAGYHFGDSPTTSIP